MPVSIELSAFGEPETQTAIENVIRDLVGPVSGDWKVSIVGSRVSEIWELKIIGPKTNYVYELRGTDGQHDPTFVRGLLIDRFAPTSAPSASLIGPVIEAWTRLSEKAGNVSDVRTTLQFVTKNWARASEDFSVTRKWGGLRESKDAELVASFEKETRLRTQEFGNLVRGVGQGPVAFEFFNTLRDLPTPLKLIAYVKGFRSASDLNRALILATLSRESQPLIELWIKEVPGDISLATFMHFLRSPSNALRPLDRVIPDLRGLRSLDLLLGISSLKVEDQNRYIAGLSSSLILELNDVSERLIRALPNELFGRFLRLRLSVFSYLAAAAQGNIDLSRRILMSEPDCGVVDVLMLREGLPAVLELFGQLRASVEEPEPTYAVTLIDLLRARAPDVLVEASEQLESWSKSKSPVLAVASQAALLKMGRISPKSFEKSFIKAARSDKGSIVANWLANNSDFIKPLSIARMPRTIWKALLTSFLPDKFELARSLIKIKLESPDADRYWQASIDILARSDAPEAEHLLSELVLQQFREDNKSENKAALNLSVARPFIQRSFWTLSSRLTEDNRVRLFDAIRKTITPIDVLQLVRSGIVNQEFSSWITIAFVPYLLTIGALPPDFSKNIGDSKFKEVLAERLAMLVLIDWEYLAKFPTIWETKCSAAKLGTSFRLQGGFQAALANTRQDSPLHIRLARLSKSLQEWTTKESKLTEPELTQALSFSIPTALTEDKAVLEAYFRRQPEHPHDLTLFLAANPWSFRYLFNERANWPSHDVLLESICDSFVYVANLKARATQMETRVDQALNLEMGIFIRSALADIEGELAGYFILREILEEIGLRPVAPKLGAVFQQSKASSEEYRIIREAGRPGRLRVFSRGVAVGDKIIDTATITQSGATNDSD